MRLSFILVTYSFAWIVSGTARFVGVNIAGCDFGCDVWGTCSNSYCPQTVGPVQMQHFSEADNFNIFRLPVGWQYLVNHNLGGQLDPSFISNYDDLVYACLATGAYCIVDIHNYARWNGGVIGQGGPTSRQFASLWTQLAQRYQSEPRVIFGIMNEPHDLNINIWARTLQLVVYAIRAANATSQMILLPGTDYAAAGSLPMISGPTLLRIKDFDGTTDRLIFDVHCYYDDNSSGKNTECVTNHITDTFRPLAKWLRENDRRAFLTETGGGNTQSCVQNVCQALKFINERSKVFLGWVGWAAGNFDAQYELSEVPNGNNDTLLVRKCIAGRDAGFDWTT